MNRQRSKTMGSLMVMGGSGGRKPNGGGGPMGHDTPISSGRVDIGLNKSQMAPLQPVQLWRSKAQKKASMMADVHQQLLPAARQSMNAARQRQKVAANMQQGLIGKSALLGKLREKTALKKLDLDRRHGEMLERMDREASHSNYDERDTYLYREHSLHHLETMMVHRRAGNEMGAAYRADDLSKPYSLAVQHGGHAHNHNRNAPNTVDFQELRRTNDPNEMRGMVVTHNHPSSQPLSDPDVITSMRYDLAQVRAVGNKGVFSLKRPQNGWNYVAPFGNGTSSQARLGSHMDAATQQDLQSSQRKDVERKLRHQVEPKSDDPKIDNLLRLRQHHQVRRFSADIGATYSAPQRYVDEMTAQLGVDYPLKQANQRSKINK